MSLGRRKTDKIKCSCNEEVTGYFPGGFLGARVKKLQFKCPRYFLDAFVKLASMNICLCVNNKTYLCIGKWKKREGFRFYWVLNDSLFSFGKLLNCMQTSKHIFYFLLSRAKNTWLWPGPRLRLQAEFTLKHPAWNAWTWILTSMKSAELLQ